MCFCFHPYQQDDAFFFLLTTLSLHSNQRASRSDCVFQENKKKKLMKTQKYGGHSPFWLVTGWRCCADRKKTCLSIRSSCKWRYVCAVCRDIIILFPQSWITQGELYSANRFRDPFCVFIIQGKKLHAIPMLRRSICVVLNNNATALVCARRGQTSSSVSANRQL